jgi:hypothetical protein
MTTIANNANKEIINNTHPGRLYETKRAFQHQTKPDHIHEKKIIAYSRNFGITKMMMPAMVDAIAPFLIVL